MKTDKGIVLEDISCSVLGLLLLIILLFYCPIYFITIVVVI